MTCGSRCAKAGPNVREPGGGGHVTRFVLSDPNMSDGTNAAVIEAIVDELRGRDGVKLVGYEPDPDFNRLPVEVIGTSEALLEALLDMAGKSYELIDMECQHGHHPRIGAVDTIQLYPLAVSRSRSASRSPRSSAGRCSPGTRCPSTSRARTRARGAEDAGGDPRRQLRGPQEGRRRARAGARHRPGELHPTAGATIVGAEPSHDAYFNIVLGTTDIEVAKRLARPCEQERRLRQHQGRDRAAVDEARVRGGVDGDLRPGRDATPRVFNLVEAEAARFGVPVVGGQICGLVAQEVLVQCAEWYLRLESINGPFDPKRQIIENHLLELTAEALDQANALRAAYPLSRSSGAPSVARLLASRAHARSSARS